MHLTRDGTSSAAVYPTLSEPWKETSAVLDDCMAPAGAHLRPSGKPRPGNERSASSRREPGVDAELDDLGLSPADWGDLQWPTSTA